MTERQKKIITALREIMEPKLEHIRKLEELCKDPARKVARDFYFMYKEEYSRYDELMQMLIHEFSDDLQK